MNKYAIVADRESVLAQHGQATLIEYESDYYGNYVEKATGRFHDMSALAKRLNADPGTATALTVRDNPEPPNDRELAQMYRLAGPKMPEGVPLPAEVLAGLRAVWRDGCDAGMVAP